MARTQSECLSPGWDSPAGSGSERVRLRFHEAEVRRATTRSNQHTLTHRALPTALPTDNHGGASRGVPVPPGRFYWLSLTPGEGRALHLSKRRAHSKSGQA